ncbi:MAG: zf-HC2 domain-containing protein [Acidiferrobacterales bacterium]|nr:zf-HC2 domain-containing protein [Acidiferrobacterales bacterium]
MTDNKDKKAIAEIDCLEAITRLYEYLDGNIDEESRASVEHHLDHCRDCFSRAEFESALTERIRESEKGKAPKSLQKRLRQLIDSF